MSTEVETGHGSEFFLHNGADPGTFVSLGELLAVPIPSGSAELIQASHMKTVGFHDYITAPLREGEEADLEMNWVPGSDTDELCAAAQNQTRDFRIVIPVGASTREFTGSVLVRNYVRNNPMDDKRTAVLTVKWVSAITEAEGE